MALNYDKIKKNRKRLRAMTGHDIREIEEELLPRFEQAYHRQELKRRVSNRQRKRCIGGGRKPTALKRTIDKLFFILVYSKTYPLQESMAAQFEMSQSQINEWVHRLMPVLEEALERGNYLPERDPAQLVKAICESQDNEFVLDGTERRRGRPVDDQEQRDHFSGKKRSHTIKNNVISERNRQRVVYLSQTYPGKVHDKKICDIENPQFPEHTILAQDSGFQGYQPDGVIIIQPKKKPYKQERPLADKFINTAISAFRIPGEHAIAGVKRMRIVKDCFRNTKKGFADLVMLVACGLHNLRVESRYPDPFITTASFS